ncbi:sulfatase-like hydrolase/transferase [Longitalea luteola]|uniref:sulfatase-like hydrolase/transferase n=1 Tax=Longitalea luteola TaxID=2812563 RepID=UPI001A959935|nr:sulfatase-like hydrolase/transferase [Longitalea luteola]
MKLSSFKTFPFHTFLLPAFFVLHVANEYFRLLAAETTIEFFLYYVLLGAFLLVVGRLAFKSLMKGGVWATALLVPFIFFGTIHDFLKTTAITRFISSYSILLPLLLICLLVFSWYCKRKTAKFEKAHHYFTVLFVILPGIELVLLAQKVITNNQQNNLAHQNDAIISIPPCDTCTKPDIFFIVFDEYASSRSLRQYFGFDNSRLDSSLKKNNFYIAENAKSNYNITPLSIGATLNGQYFNVLLENKVTTGRVILQGLYALEESRLPHLLERSGYAIHNFGLCDLKRHPVQTSRYFEEYERLALYDETLWYRINRDILWNMSRLNLSFWNIMQQRKNQQNQAIFVERNRKNWQLILQELKEQNDQPKFVFGHIMMPHSPFYLDKHGNRTNDFSRVYENHNNEGAYLEQLQYTNSWIDSLLIASDRNFSRPRVVIVAGDHGYREVPYNPERRDRHFMNLNTYYFSDKDYSMLYDSISPVNTFRVVINKYFHTKLPLLKDSTILLQETQPGFSLSSQLLN